MVGKQHFRMLSTKFLSTLDAVLYVAMSSEKTPVKRSHLPDNGHWRRFLEPTLQQLVRAGILKSLRGPLGGYTLGRDAAEITLIDIFAVISGMETFEGKQEARTLVAPGVRLVVDEINARWTAELAHITIADLRERSA